MKQAIKNGWKIRFRANIVYVGSFIGEEFLLSNNRIERLINILFLMTEFQDEFYLQVNLIEINTFLGLNSKSSPSVRFRSNLIRPRNKCAATHLWCCYRCCCCHRRSRVNFRPVWRISFRGCNLQRKRFKF